MDRHSSALLHEAACPLVWRKFSTLEGSTAYWTPPGSVPVAAVVHSGIDLGSSAEGYLSTFGGRLHLNLTREGAKLRTSSDGWLKVGECDVATASGERWYTQRIGPLRSEGGYDYFNFFINDVAGLSARLDARAPGEELGISAHVMGAVTADGVLLSVPPVHYHHVHLAPSFTFDPRKALPLPYGGLECALHNRHCASLEAMIFQHGDCTCTRENGGTECYGHDYHDYRRQFYAPLSIYAQINDIRPKHSPTMEWFYQLAIRVGTDVAGGGAIPLSMQNVNNPYTYNVPADTFISTMVMPSNVDSFHYFACRWPLFDGTLVHSDLHSHQPFFKGCFLYKGLPALLGLGEGKCKHEEAFTAIPISSTGFGSSEALREHLLSDLTKLGHTTVCNVDGQLEKVDGEWYDRVSLVSCTPTRFRAGDAWTVVGFFGQRKPGERMFGLRAGQPAAMHTNPHLYYVADDGKSHYTSSTAALTHQPHACTLTCITEIVITHGACNIHTPMCVLTAHHLFGASLCSCWHILPR
uniref:Uncharacterized protein n=1 Tax=Prymnesium polylepis TaxID=72548 RepID=A0A7S4NN70_9EUKA